jgi:DNA-binding Lrp family transcriptional regulator
MSAPKLDVLRAFISTPKPEGFTVIDFGVVACLLCNGLAPLTIANPTIASRIGCGSKAVGNSVKRLKASGVIVKVSGKRQKKANTYTVQIDALSTPPDFKKAVTTQAAYELADQYMLLLRRDHGKVKSKKSGRSYSRQLPRGWRNRWAFVIQKHLTAGNTPKYLLEMFHDASQHFPKEFVIGPQAWSRRIPKPTIIPSPIVPPRQ